MTAQRVDALVKSPALALTPAEVNRQITAAGSAGRAEDRRVIAAAGQTIEEVATKRGRQLEFHVMADEQRRRLWRVGFAEPIARVLPASWLLPERIAVGGQPVGDRQPRDAGSMQAAAASMTG